ncbi:Phenylacrylic acid decarboxylase [Candidatus Magnetoovum chiemensis]|nr:Phenylacrylic acid decarboxylase [Candidatus Magnetoovum chiemensis]
MNKYIAAITGASGSILGIRLVKELVKTSQVHLIISKSAFNVIKEETQNDWSDDTENRIRRYYESGNIHFYRQNQLDAPIASGSFIVDGMFVVPCSMKTLSAIANGYADNLIVRCADVMIKECRRLVLSPREMPFSAIHLENMLKLSRLSAVIAPPAPAFYSKPQKLDDMIDFIVGKLLDSMRIEHNLFKRWGTIT